MDKRKFITKNMEKRHHKKWLKEEDLVLLTNVKLHGIEKGKRQTFKDLTRSREAIAVRLRRLNNQVIPQNLNDTKQREFYVNSMSKKSNTPKTILTTTEDNTNPSYYKTGRIEVIDFIESQKLDFRLANVIKYVCRAKHKGDEINDLKKALWYLNRVVNEKHS